MTKKKTQRILASTLAVLLLLLTLSVSFVGFAAPERSASMDGPFAGLSALPMLLSARFLPA